MENEIMFIKLDDIIPNRFQPREVFEEESLQKLADSIRRHGVIEPILVRPISNKYEIIAGERRYKASVLAGLTKIPAIVKQMDDKESSIVAYIENEHRNNVSAIEEARTIDRILKSNDLTQEELATELGINQSTLANKLRLLTLPLEIQESLMHNEISERHARSLLSVKDETKQIELLKKIKEKRMTVRELDNEIKNMSNYSINNMQDIEMNNLFDGNLNDYNNSNSNSNPLPTSAPLNNEAYLNNVDSMVQPINTNTYLNNQPLTEKTQSNEFMNYLNNYDNSNPFPTNESSNVETYLNNVDSVNQSVNNETYLNNEISTEQTESNEFMNYLNNYDNNNPLSTNDPLNNEAYLNNVDSMEQPININENINNQPQAEQTENNEFLNYLNNYDNDNLLPTNDPLNTEAYLNNVDSTNPPVNNKTYLNSQALTDQPINNDYYNESIDNNVVINNVNPPITSNFNNNTYIENTENYVDVSKNNFINNFDETINKLKVVVDDIKSNSSFKIDTDEINYDDMYQITIKIDKRDF